MTPPVFTPTGVVVALRQQAFGTVGYVRRYSLADGAAVEFGPAYGSSLGLIATLDSSPVVANGVIAMYRGPTVGVPLIIQVGAFDLATGNLLWSSPTTQNLTPVMTAANDMLLQCDGTVKIRSLKTGAVAAGALANQPCSGPITVAAGKIIFFDPDQHRVRVWGL